jgi:ribosome-associated protein
VQLDKIILLNNPKFLAFEAANALAEVKGKDIALLEVTEVSSFADFFVLVTGDSHVHMRALADRVRERMAKLGIQLGRTEGRESRTWILLDYHSLIVHIFSPAARDFYDLSRLWGDAREIAFSDSDESAALV